MLFTKGKLLHRNLKVQVQVQVIRVIKMVIRFQSIQAKTEMVPVMVAEKEPVRVMEAVKEFHSHFQEEN
ncbi:MAG: hypothetical protein IPN61_09990 [Bacteroidetes bacterium]|nr:hypothetical protein [Bacteroidota bacterium]